jgi:ataxia telangiectasia mutated family protein
MNTAQSFAHKFVPLKYQIASRLGPFKQKDASDFHFCVWTLVYNMAKGHPLHCIYTLLSLANVDILRDDSKGEEAYTPNTAKKKVTEDLIKALKGIGEPHKRIIQAIESFTKALLVVSDRQSKFPKEQMSFQDDTLNKVKDLTQIPVPTMSFPIPIPGASVEQQIESSIRIHEFSTTVKFADSGISRPMILNVTGQDGCSRGVLLKVKDDLRQDAVMQQLFGLANLFLATTSATRRRQLRIRTYNVIPLTPAVGILEWVPNTRALSDLLPATHRTHHRNDWSRQQMIEVFNSDKQPDARARFEDVCKNCTPCFHKFFLDTYQDPFEWFSRRTAYTRSVAANSMMGFIAGIGDRHIGNILMDVGTAELVHIDLGVAFDQGKFLRTPELIPFRLTRDLVDGMGAAGIEGVFRRCCEETMAVFRANADCLSTVITVFQFDPLYKWSLSPSKMRALQRRKSDELGSAAARAPGAASSASGGSEGPHAGADENGAQENVNAQVRGCFFFFIKKNTMFISAYASVHNCYFFVTCTILSSSARVFPTSREVGGARQGSRHCVRGRARQLAHL